MAVRRIGWRRGRRTLALALLCLGLTVSAGTADEMTLPAVSGAAPDIADIPIWKSITLGTHRSIAGLREALDAAHCWVGTLAESLFDGRKFAASAAEMEVDLVIVTPVDLDLGTQSRSLAEIHERAVQLGLQLCPAEVAPQLRLQYRDQPTGEFLHVAMTPIAAREGELAAFIVGNGGAGLLLIAGEARADLEIPATVRFVFVRPR